MGKKALGSVLVFLLAMVVTGCGDDDDGAADTPPEKCEAFKSSYCSKAATCGESEGLLDPAQHDTLIQQCRDAFQGTLDCGRAVGISATYDTCLSEWSAAPCGPIVAAIQAKTNPLPASCSGIILVPQQ